MKSSYSLMELFKSRDQQPSVYSVGREREKRDSNAAFWRDLTGLRHVPPWNLVQSEEPGLGGPW